MTVTRTSKSSTSAATSRLAAAMAKSTAPSAATVTPKPSSLEVRATTTATHAAVRGALAGPEAAAAGTGAAAAAEGARNVLSVAPGADTTAGGSVSSAPSSAPSSAYSPRDASSDAYAAADSTVPSPTPVQGTGAWSPTWQAIFEQLQLTPADIEYLAQGGHSEQDLSVIAAELSRLDPPSPAAPQPGVDAGTTASANGPTPVGVAPAGQPGFDTSDGAANVQPESAWSPEWAAQFGTLMKRMGLSRSEISQQLSQVEGQPLSEQQLSETYRQMEASIGDFDDAWKGKFERLMKELKMPADMRQQDLSILASSGMNEAKLRGKYAELQAKKPAWSEKYENKFKALDIPAAPPTPQYPHPTLKGLRESGATKEVLDKLYQQLLDTEKKYSADGRLDKLRDADATPAEMWDIMLKGAKGKAFDKAVEQTHSAHVPAWKRVAGFAVNMIPGVYTAQYLTSLATGGRVGDWVTGEKIDTSNPLNIIGAVASGFAGGFAVRGAMQGVQGLTAASRAASATMQVGKAGTLAGSVKALGSASPLSQGAFQAVQGAGLVTKFEKGLKFRDYLKAAAPIVNRFGEAGRLSAVGRGYTQGMQLAAGSAALQTVKGGGAVIDPITKGAVLGQLKQGKGIEQAVAAATRSDEMYSSAQLAAGYNKVGFLQGNVAGKFGVGTGSGSFRFNPFRNTATIADSATPNVLSLGRGVNFGSKGGLAQGLGATQAANGISNSGGAARAASRAAADAHPLIADAKSASRIAGVNIADDAQRAATFKRTAKWAEILGVPSRPLTQLGSSNRAAARVASVAEHGGSTGYRAGRQVASRAAQYGGFTAAPALAGAAVGVMGSQQPVKDGWEYLKNRGEIQAKERTRRADAAQEQVERARQYTEEQAEGAAAPTDAVTPTAGAGEAPQVVGTSATGGQLVFDPSYGAVIDTANGDVYDPQSGAIVGNLAQAQGAAPAVGSAPAAGPAPAAAPAPASAVATPATGADQVYVDPATGYYVDPSTGLMADPASGKVYDPKSGAVVGNVPSAQQSAA